jgi:hypothetical protein
MNWCERVLLTSILLVATAASDPAHAQTQIRVGEAVLIQNQVVRVAESLSMPINVGDSLMRDEIARTWPRSAGSGPICSAPTSKAISTAGSCNPLRTIPASSPP